MPTTFIALFLAGILTILLPCILPLLPIVLGVSVAGRHKLRPLFTIAGMVAGFVLFTFILQVLLSQFVTLSDIVRISTYYVLLLFGICFLTGYRIIRLLAAIIGGFYYGDYGWTVVAIAAITGIIAVDIGGRIANKLQQFGADVQQSARASLGTESLMAAFIIGMTLGLVWVPCAGPALAFALTLVRDQPGIDALLALFAYALGTAVPLLIISYGGQWAVHSIRKLSPYTGRIKQVAGVILILTSLGFQYGFLMKFQTWITEATGFGELGSQIEEKLFPGDELPALAPAPEFAGLGPWHNAGPLTLSELKGKVVLVDFWTYSCINCIRTFPYLRGYWEKYKDMPFVLIGVHTPEFIFEKDPDNVKKAIENHGLTYPVAQDNDYGTWTAFRNRYWPAKYLIDAQGNIRYTHFGEGEYEETDEAIAALLKEIGVEGEEGIEGIEGIEDQSRFMPRSPETYLGERSWEALVNAYGDPDEEVHAYSAPSSLPLHSYALVGDWQMLDGERQVLRSSSGEIRYRALASEVNLVLGLEDEQVTAEAEVFVDGKAAKTFTVNKNDLFNLFKGEYGEHEIILKLRGKGIEAYAFTFGA